MAPHEFCVPWGGENKIYSSPGVGGETVQRNINDIRAAVHYAEDNLRTLALMFAAYESAERGEPVRMDYAGLATAGERV